MNVFKASNLMLVLSLLATVSVSANEMDAATASMGDPEMENTTTTEGSNREMESPIDSMNDFDTVKDIENEVEPELTEPKINKFIKKAKRFVARKTGHEADDMDNGEQEYEGDDEDDSMMSMPESKEQEKSMDAKVKHDQTSAQDTAASKKLDDEINALLKQIAASASNKSPTSNASDSN